MQFVICPYYGVKTQGFHLHLSNKIILGTSLTPRLRVDYSIGNMTGTNLRLQRGSVRELQHRRLLPRRYRLRLRSHRRRRALQCGTPENNKPGTI